jgi:hypothetical protein
MGIPRELLGRGFILGIAFKNCPVYATDMSEFILWMRERVVGDSQPTAGSSTQAFIGTGAQLKEE